MFSRSDVQFLVCAMCSLQSQPSSLRSKHASLCSVWRKHACIYSKLVKTKVGVQICWGGLSSKQPMSYRHIYICIYMHVYMYVNIGIRDMGSPEGHPGTRHGGPGPLGRQCGRPKGALLLWYTTVQGVVGTMRCKERVQMQQSRASSVNSLRYGRFCGP